MKSVRILVLFPLLSVIVVGLYAAGGVSRTVAIALLIASFVGTTFLILRKKKV
jgi:hypothetical protein